MMAAAAREQIIIALQRCCGAACELALDQMPSVADPELRAAFTSWARLDASGRAVTTAGVGRTGLSRRGNGAAVEVTP
jgi:hypothetical protein